MKAILHTQITSIHDPLHEAQMAATKDIRLVLGLQMKLPLPPGNEAKLLLPSAMRILVPLFAILFFMSQVLPGN